MKPQQQQCGIDDADVGGDNQDKLTDPGTGKTRQMADDLSSLVAENTRRRIANNSLKARVTELEGKLAEAEKVAQSKDKALADLQKQHDDRQAEYDKKLAGMDDNKLVQEIGSLKSQIAKRNMADRFAKQAGDKVLDGVSFDAVARTIGLNLDDIDPDKIDDRFVDEVLTQIKTSAPYLLRPASTGTEQTTQQGSSLESLAAKRRLPTFTSATSGGGSPPPVDNPLSTARLRDPADAIRRAAEARAQRSQPSA